MELVNSSLQTTRQKPDVRAAQFLPPGREELRSVGPAFFWLSAFYLVYCARPEDWIPGLYYIPLAKISGIFAVLGMMFSLGKTKRKFRDLPRETIYLLSIICLMVLAALFSPVWKGGAMFHTLDFAKVLIVFVLTFLLVTDFFKFRRVIFIQTASVVVVCLISVAKHGGHPRLEGVLGGIYSNPNDLAFAIVLSMPFCLAFLLSTRGALRKAVWSVSMLVMLGAVFMTGSRGGFITLVVAGTVLLWHFGVRGRRMYLIAVAVVAGAILMGLAGGVLRSRFSAMAGGAAAQDVNGYEASAYGSYEERRQLMITSLKAISHYPILGLGSGNFVVYSGAWLEVHAAYLQIAAEVGIPALVLYLLFFKRGFGNLRKLRKMRDLDPEKKLFVGALHSSLIGFMTGICFAPEAYQFFPYFSVAYTAVLLATVTEAPPEAPPVSRPSLNRFEAKSIFAHLGKVHEPTSVR